MHCEVDEITKSGVRLPPENVTVIGKPIHCLYDDLDRGMEQSSYWHSIEKTVRTWLFTRHMPTEWCWQIEKSAEILIPFKVGICGPYEQVRDWLHRDSAIYGTCLPIKYLQVARGIQIFSVSESNGRVVLALACLYASQLSVILLYRILESIANLSWNKMADPLRDQGVISLSLIKL